MVREGGLRRRHSGGCDWASFMGRHRVPGSSGWVLLCVEPNPVVCFCPAYTLAPFHELYVILSSGSFSAVEMGFYQLLKGDSLWSFLQEWSIFLRKRAGGAGPISHSSCPSSTPATCHEKCFLRMLVSDFCVHPLAFVVKVCEWIQTSLISSITRGSLSFD